MAVSDVTIFTLQLLYLPLSSSPCSSSVLLGFAGPTHTLKCGSAPTDSKVCLCVVSAFAFVVSLFVRVKRKWLTSEKLKDWQLLICHTLKVAFLRLYKIADSEMKFLSVTVKPISVKSEVHRTSRHTVSWPL